MSTNSDILVPGLPDTRRAAPHSTDHHRVTQGSVIRAEWIKLRSVRSNFLGLAAASVLLVLLGMLFASLVGSDQQGGPPNLSDDPLSISFGGMNMSQLIIGVLAAVFVAGEYATGMIRTMFGAVTDRLPVMWAKAAVFGGATWVLMTVSSLVAFFGGQAVYAGDQATYAITDPGVLRAVLGAGLYAAGVAVLGVALGFILRSAAATIGVLVGTLMILPVLVSLLPSSINETVGKVLPSNAGTAFMSVAPHDTLFSPAVGFGVFMLWIIGALVAAIVVLRHRDA
jgi:ABC-2 type transport system permease protein